MSKADGNCTRCKGRCIVDSMVVYAGIPGGCFACGATGSYADQQRRIKEAQEAEAARELWYKVAPPIIARAQRIRDHKTREAIRALYKGVFKTVDIAGPLGLDVKEVFGQLAYDLQRDWLRLEIVDGKAVAWKRVDFLLDEEIPL